MISRSAGVHEMENAVTGPVGETDMGSAGPSRVASGDADNIAALQLWLDLTDPPFRDVHQRHRADAVFHLANAGPQTWVGSQIAIAPPVDRHLDGAVGGAH